MVNLYPSPIELRSHTIMEYYMLLCCYHNSPAGTVLARQAQGLEFESLSSQAIVFMTTDRARLHLKLMNSHFHFWLVGKKSFQSLSMLD